MDITGSSVTPWDTTGGGGVVLPWVRKGGTGKTTSVVSFAADVAARGGRALIVDTDEQRNASIIVEPIMPSGELFTVLDVISWGERGIAAEAIVGTEWSQHPPIRDAGGVVDIIVGDSRFKDSEVGTYGVEKLAETLTGLSEEYDLILLDSPPSSGLVVQSAFCAADKVLMVSEAQHLSVVGLTESVALLDEFNQAAVNLEHLKLSPAQFVGVIITKMKPQLEHLAAVKEVEAMFGDRLWKPVVPDRAVVQQAMAAHFPIVGVHGSAAQEVTDVYHQLTTTLMSAGTVDITDREVGVH